MTVHVIFYRRPETPWSLSRMTTQGAAQAAYQVERLIALGYQVAEVTPLLAEAGNAPANDLSTAPLGAGTEP